VTPSLVLTFLSTQGHRPPGKRAYSKNPVRMIAHVILIPKDLLFYNE
jgi:hypothetical protein